MARGDFVVVKVKAELSFLNDKPPVYFQKKPVYVSVLAETSDGRKAHFGRIRQVIERVGWMTSADVFEADRNWAPLYLLLLMPS